MHEEGSEGGGRLGQACSRAQSQLILLAPLPATHRLVEGAVAAEQGGEERGKERAKKRRLKALQAQSFNPSHSYPTLSPSAYAPCPAALPFPSLPFLPPALASVLQCEELADTPPLLTHQAPCQPGRAQCPPGSGSSPHTCRTQPAGRGPCHPECAHSWGQCQCGRRGACT